MLTIAECREYLDTETTTSMSDDEVARVRDDLYALARIFLSRERKYEYEKERLD